MIFFPRNKSVRSCLFSSPSPQMSYHFKNILNRNKIESDVLPTSPISEALIHFYIKTSKLFEAQLEARTYSLHLLAALHCASSYSSIATGQLIIIYCVFCNKEP